MLVQPGVVPAGLRRIYRNDGGDDARGHRGRPWTACAWTRSRRSSTVLRRAVPVDPGATDLHREEGDQEEAPAGVADVVGQAGAGSGPPAVGGVLRAAVLRPLPWFPSRHGVVTPRCGRSITQWHGTEWFIEGDISDCFGSSGPSSHAVDPGREDPRRPVPAADRRTAPGRISGGLAMPSHPERCAARRRGLTRSSRISTWTGWTPTSSRLCCRPITRETDADHIVRTCGCGAARAEREQRGTGQVVGGCAGR